MGEGGSLLAGGGRALGSLAYDNISVLHSMETNLLLGVNGVRRTKEVVKERATTGLMATRRAAAMTVRCMNMARQFSAVRSGLVVRRVWRKWWPVVEGFVR